jgi:DNA-binding CsgD family transcriptional regulator/PAS domain-containing protein
MRQHFQTEFPDDPRLVASNNFPGKPLSCRLSIGEEAWHQSDVYKFSLQYADQFPIIEYSLTVTLPDHGRSLTGLAVMRWPEGKAFSQEDCDLLGDIIPHLKRALGLQKHFVQTDFRHRSILEALDHVPTGIVIPNGDGQIRHANRAAQEIAERADGLSLTRNIITLSRQSEHKDLMMSIRRAVTSAGNGTILPGQAISVTRDDGNTPYPALVSTLWGNNIKLGLSVLDAPLAAIFISDPDRPQEAPAALLERLYGLTPSEAKLVERLIAGDTVKDAAITNGISENTARQYLKSVFQKTGTQRQATLVKKVMSSPIWLQHHTSPNGSA